jgi:hypothetical protein
MKPTGKEFRAPYLMRPGGTVRSVAGGERYSMGAETRERLQQEARRRGTTMGRLIGDILDAISEDDMFAAILDN